MAATELPSTLLEGLLKAFRRLRDRHADMTLLQAMCFFTVATKQGITQRALYEELSASDSAASRILAVLSDIGDRKTAGLDLVSMRVNPNDRRERLLYLTPKGRRLIDDIAADLGDVAAVTVKEKV
jgi:DNA-binding MarR family transcriptional regulator